MKALNFFLLTVLTILMYSCQDDLLRDVDPNSVETTTHSERSCGKDHVMESLLQDPEYAKRHREKFEAVNNYIGLRGCGEPTVIPVAVHFQGATGANRSCLETLVKSQMDILNNDLTGTNGDISKWVGSASAHFPGLQNGEACLKFCLADQNHPSGFGLNNGDPAITINQTSGDQLSAWKGYLNIIVRSGIGDLGYSPLGGDGDGDAVVINATAFGSGSGCGNVRPGTPFNLGRTTTHEVGHYLFLDHIWGGGCSHDDGVGDTPNSDDAYFGCPALGVKSCGSKDLHMNYMDYTDDQCMYMFSAGQATVMENYVHTSLKHVIAKGKLVCSSSGSGGGGGPSATDDAGVQSVSAPQGSYCERKIKPIITLKNFGTTNLTQVQVKYGFDGSYTKSLAWNGNLVPGKSVKVTLAQLTLPTGHHNFNAKTEKPNGKADANNTNDKSTSSFEVAAEGNYTLTIKPDDWGGDITWKLFDGNNKVVGKGGPYADFDRSKKTASFCLPDDCYTFKIYDSWGDGICCAYGYGYYDLKNGQGREIFSSDGRYGSLEKKKFCVDSGKSRVISSERDQKKAEARNKYF